MVPMENNITPILPGQQKTTADITLGAIPMVKTGFIFKDGDTIHVINFDALGIPESHNEYSEGKDIENTDDPMEPNSLYFARLFYYDLFMRSKILHVVRFGVPAVQLIQTGGPAFWPTQFKQCQFAVEMKKQLPLLN